MIRIRPAVREDIEFLVNSQLQMARETEEIQLDRPTVVRGVKALFDAPAKGRYWLAEINDKPAGCLLTVPEWSDWRNGTVLWIHSLYVWPDHRGQGVFRKLYEHLRRMVEADESLKGLRLYVDKSNAAARRIYEALGMDGEHYQTYEWMKQ